MTRWRIAPRYFVAEWLPIETAPMDGSWVLVAAYDYPEGRIVRAKWDCTNWVAYYGSGQMIRLDARLWMPLPPLPHESEVKKKEAK